MALPPAARCDRRLSCSSLGNDGSYNFSVVGVGAGGGGREVVTALRPWVQYAVVVRAYNAHGSGPISPPVVVRTLEDGKWRRVGRSATPSHCACSSNVPVNH